MLDAITVKVSSSGVLTIYAGGQPADCSAATTAGNTVLATLLMAATSFGAAAASIMTANAIANDTSAVGGTAAWFSITNSTGARVMDGSVGATAATYDLVLNSVTITTGATIAVSSVTVTIPS